MSTIQTYLQQLNEQSKKYGSLEGSEKATLEPLNVKDLGIEEPVEDESNTGVDNKKTTEEKVKYNHMSKENVFEQLYKRAINEDFDDASDNGGGMGGDEFGGGDMSGDSGDNEFGGDADASDYDADPSHVGKVKEVVQLLQQALDLLSSFEGEEEEEYEEYGDDMDDESDEEGFGDDMDDEEPVTEEDTQFGQAKTIGHALVNRETFNKSQTKKSNMVVKGSNPKVSSKKAAPQYGKNINGKPSNFSDAGGKKMQGKGHMKVAGRASNTGKFAFED